VNVRGRAGAAVAAPLAAAVLSCAPVESYVPTFLISHERGRAQVMRRREAEGAVEHLARGTWDERAQARERLTAMGREAREVLMERARHAFPEVAVPAMEVLARDADAQVRAFLADLLVRHPDAAVRRRAAEILAVEDDGGAFAALARAARADEAVSVREAAVRALGTGRHPAAGEVLLEALEDPHPDVVRAAHAALGVWARVEPPPMPRDIQDFRVQARAFWSARLHGAGGER
jgi:hypothetical protein